MVLLLVLGAVARIWYFIADCPFDLTGDEAYYWQWSRRLDLSYADTNGPLTAYIIAGSRALLADWSVRVKGSEVLAVRLPAVALSVLTGVGIYVLAASVLRRPAVALAAVAITFTIPILVTGAALMTIDAPLACAWTWALVCVRRALERDTLAAWLATGLLIAVGILAKYNMMLLFAVVGVLLLVEPSLRRFLLRPGPYLATAVGLCGLLPILIWNAGHDWVSFRQVTRQAGLASGFGIDVDGPLVYLASQATVVGPIWFVGMVWAAIELCRRPTTGADEPYEPWAVRLLVLATAVPWLVFLGFSLITKTQPNWPALALIGGTILLAAWLARHGRVPGHRRRVRIFVAAGALLGAGAVILVHRTDWLTPMFTWLARGAPPLRLTQQAAPWDLTPVSKYDPTVRMRGWRELGMAVGGVLQEERAAGRQPFILAEDYQLASEVAFYCPGEPTVYAAQSALGKRPTQYDMWPNPIRDRAAFVGRPCLYVGSLHPELTGGSNGAAAALPGLRPVRTVEYRIRGEVVQLWTIFACDAFAGFSVPAGR